jgi:hypothetical protein
VLQEFPASYENHHAEEELVDDSIGGKGYTFADKVAARLLAQMLARSFPLDAALGLITEVHFETKESRRSLDDLHVILKDGAARFRWPISVKCATVNFPRTGSITPS